MLRVCWFWLILTALLGSASGCTPLRTWVRNGFKVGPNHVPPTVDVEKDWIDQDSPLLATDPVDEGAWWRVLGDPALDDLTRQVRDRNWTLRELGARVMASRAQLDYTKGRLFPQFQNINGYFNRYVVNFEGANSPIAQLLGYDPYFNISRADFAVAWEADFWGKYRRAIESQAAELDASIAQNDQGLVMLQAEVASAYIQYRVAQAELNLYRRLAEFERDIVELSRTKFKAGAASEVDPRLSEASFHATLAKLHSFELQMRQAMNRISVLTGQPPNDLGPVLTDRPMPALPEKLVVGIPQDLVRRRPDLRQAERVAAAQCARIGVASSELLPALSLNGSIGVVHSGIVGTSVTNGFIGPSVSWNVLNYGRLLAKVRYEDAKLSEAIFALQNKALEAQREVEDGIIGYLKQGDIVGSLEKAAASSRRALELGIVQYNEGTATYLWVYNLEQNFARIADGLIAARGNQLLSLVDTYRSLGGGWNLPLPETEAAASAAEPADVLPVPRPNPISRIEDLPLPRVRQPVPGDGQ